MINNNFEVYKLRRELKRSGRCYRFQRATVNTYGESDGVMEVVGDLVGLYHEQNSHVAITMTDTTQIRTKKVPSILCLYEDVKPLDLIAGDIVVVNGKRMKVTGIVNVQEWNMIADISLEVIDYGGAH